MWIFSFLQPVPIGFDSTFGSVWICLFLHFVLFLNVGCCVGRGSWRTSFERSQTVPALQTFPQTPLIHSFSKWIKPVPGVSCHSQSYWLCFPVSISRIFCDSPAFSLIDINSTRVLSLFVVHPHKFAFWFVGMYFYLILLCKFSMTC